MAFDSSPNVNTLAQALAGDPDAKGKIYSRQLEVQSQTSDDFAKFEGAPKSMSPVWMKRDLAADGGDTIKMTAIGGAGGPGVRGEEELTGNTSNINFGGFSVQVDFWRDAVELTKKQIKFLAGGQSVESVTTKMLGEKLGRQKQNDGMITLIKKATSYNIYRPGNRWNRDAILAVDGLTPSAFTEAKARAQGIGARPTGMTKSKSGSPVPRYLGFACQDSLTEFRNSNQWSNAIMQAAVRADDNPIFSGQLFDWGGTNLWEHIVVDPDVDDYIGSAVAPKAKLGVAIASGTTVVDLKMSATNTRNRYFQFFPGYDYVWVEGQPANPDNSTYYAWIIDPAQNKAMFVSYVGTGNNGNKITITNRLGSAATGAALTTLGAITWDGSFHTDHAGVDSWILPANAKGTPIGYSFILGAGALLRAVGSIEAEPITQERDYKFVKGMGYEGIFGHNVALDSQGRPRHYVLIEHAIEHPGIIIPGTWGV